MPRGRVPLEPGPSCVSGQPECQVVALGTVWFTTREPAHGVAGEPAGRTAYARPR